jgi:hypothetical protein
MVKETSKTHSDNISEDEKNNITEKQIFGADDLMNYCTFYAC